MKYLSYTISYRVLQGESIVKILQKKSSIFITIAVILAFILLISSIFYTDTDQASSPTTPTISSDSIPTIFVHGFKGSAHSFDGMLDRFQRQHWGKKEMVIYVTNEGDTIIKGNISKNVMHPLIQVVFHNNRASFQETAGYLKKVMRILYTQYDIQEVNIVGHSMGGIISTKYIEETYHKKDYPTTHKLITIGSPFQGVILKRFKQNPNNTGAAAIDLVPHSKALKILVQNSRKFDPNIQVLAIAGVIEDKNDGDGLVSLYSAFGGKNIVPKNQFHTKIVYGKSAYHSGLHENKNVDLLVSTFLWGNHKKIKHSN